MAMIIHASQHGLSVGGTGTFVVAVLLIMCVVINLAAVEAETEGEAVLPEHHQHITMSFNKSCFPKGFVFGAGTAAYQSEGAAHIDGKGPSIWDNYTREHRDKIWDHSNGDVADDFYHRYAEDIKLMKKMGLDSFRFSISWSRVLPKGKVSGGVNRLGIKFYNRLIDDLLANGIQPFVTLFHWDLPLALNDEYSGFLSSNIVEDFREYADLCFKEFGDRVKKWCTLNEPYSYSVNGYSGGTFAPGRCSRYAGNCTVGNSATEPYIVAHNLLLSHAAAVRLYKAKYQATQKGEIGITIVTNWYIPKSPKSVADQQAAERTVEFLFGWFAHPITYGDYPPSMRRLVGERLPKFSKQESKMLAGSLDYMGINYYTTNFAADNPVPHGPNTTFFVDIQAFLTTSKAGVPIGTPTGLNWLFIYPRGIHSLMLYVRDKYKNPPVYITENGLADASNDTLPISAFLKDGMRIRYLHLHLQNLLLAIKEGANVKGYYAWSLFDDFEWDAGYTVRFGMIYVDFKNHLKRYLKYSAYWYKMFLLH